MDNQLRRGVKELDKADVKWRKLKCREILNIDKAGPYIYTMDKDIPYNYMPLNVFAEHAISISKSSIYVLWHREGIDRVKTWAFNKYFDDGIYYCTMFDDTFSWFAFTDDHCVENGVVKMVYRNEKKEHEH